MKEIIRKSILPVLLLACLAVSMIRISVLSAKQSAQYENSRWQGSADMEFSQYTCLVPETSALDLESIYKLRYDIRGAIKDAAVDIGSNHSNDIFTDCWSCRTSLKIYSEKANAEVSVFGVGGNFFNFHPMTLLSGSYFGESDVMDDRVILDKETAWRLFGGMDLTGLTINIQGTEFTIAGVVENAEDKLSEATYTDGNAIYLSYTALNRLQKNAKLSISTPTCYEIVCPEPVKGFTYGIIDKLFPVKNAIVIENSNRFGFIRLIKVAFNAGTRAIHDKPISYPYWENAARLTETRCGTYAIVVALSSAAIVVCLAVQIKELFPKISKMIRKPKLSSEQ